MDAEMALWQSSTVFAPGFPRQTSNKQTIQAARYSRDEFCAALADATTNEMPGYYSVYAFPHGHSRDGNIPRVNCIFIDLDIANGDYKPNEGDTAFSAWKRDMSALLARARMIATAILESGREDHFRAVLSGHKGLHLYLDFPTVSRNNGTMGQFKDGLKTYSERVMDWLDSTAGGINIDPWVDVDGSDLGRLARHPNTVHHSAAYDDEQRWAVPITVSELSDLQVDDYLSLTRGPRWPDGYKRVESESAGNKVVQAVRNADGTSRPTSGSSTSYNPKAVSEYDEQANHNIELDDLLFLCEDRPSIEAFRNRDDAYRHGNESHIMEINIIARFVQMSVPRSVMHEFFSAIPGYDKAQTDAQIDKIIGRDYKEFSLATIAERAPTFSVRRPPRDSKQT